MNSKPQHDVAKGKGQSDLLRARPTTLSRLVLKNPSPVNPSGASTILIPQLLVSFSFMLNLTGRAIVLFDD
jgi:hypothetical protein